MRLTSLALATVSVLTVSSVARAEPGDGDTEGTTTSAPKEEIVVPSSSTGGKTTVIVVPEDDPRAKPPRKPPPEKDEASTEDDDGDGRFRGGVSGVIGAFIPGPVLQIGAEGRLGYQINDLYAVYGDFGAHAGVGFGVGSEGATLSAGAAIFTSVLFEVTLADVFFIGAGPTLMYGAFATADAFATPENVNSEVSVFAGALPGIKLRTGVGFGSDRRNRRKQFTLALQANIIFGQRYQVTTSGVDESSSVGVGVGVLPMLSLGYDAK